jgi:hypothetical protein
MGPAPKGVVCFGAAGEIATCRPEVPTGFPFGAGLYSRPNGGDPKFKGCGNRGSITPAGTCASTEQKRLGCVIQLEDRLVEVLKLRPKACSYAVNDHRFDTGGEQRLLPKYLPSSLPGSRVEFPCSARSCIWRMLGTFTGAVLAFLFNFYLSRATRDFSGAQSGCLGSSNVRMKWSPNSGGHWRSLGEGTRTMRSRYSEVWCSVVGFCGGRGLVLI